MNMIVAAWDQIVEEEGWREKQRQRSWRLVWGQNLFISLLRQLFCLGLFGRKDRIRPIFPNQPRQNSQRGEELKKFCPKNRRDDLCLYFSLHPSSRDQIDSCCASRKWFTEQFSRMQSCGGVVQFSLILSVMYSIVFTQCIALLCKMIRYFFNKFMLHNYEITVLFVILSCFRLAM